MGPLTGLEGPSPREAGGFSQRSGGGTGSRGIQTAVEEATGQGNEKKLEAVSSPRGPCHVTADKDLGSRDTSSGPALHPGCSWWEEGRVR